jgi:23S rRNA (cytosine1962-C5)-methyltransferase
MARHSSRVPGRIASIEPLLDAARARRSALAAGGRVTTYRVFGAGEGVEGLFIDRYGPGAVLAVHESAGLDRTDIEALGALVLRVLAEDGVEAVYYKPFLRDRASAGDGESGTPASVLRDPHPLAGTALPERLIVREYDCRYEVRLYDGFSTGLFLDQRENRRALAALEPPRALNLFSYTCAFAVPLVAAGAHVTNVDVSARYLDWGRRNLAVNDLPADRARFVRMDARRFPSYAVKHAAERFELVVIDPPTFGAPWKRRGAKAWSAAADYEALVAEAARVLAPGGAMFASTNTRALSTPGTLQALVARALGRTPEWLPLPPAPVDFERAPNRPVALLCR